MEAADRDALIFSTSSTIAESRAAEKLEQLGNLASDSLAQECPARTARRQKHPRTTGRISFDSFEIHSPADICALLEICLFSDAVLQSKKV
jgi:hypothetical protein